jgi:hypothetical protein
LFNAPKHHEELMHIAILATPRIKMNVDADAPSSVASQDKVMAWPKAPVPKLPNSEAPN